MFQPINHQPDSDQNGLLVPFRDTCYSRELSAVRTQVQDRFVRAQQERLTASRQDSLNDFRVQQAKAEDEGWFHLAGKYEIERKLRYELQRAKRYRRYLALLVAKVDRQEQLEQQLSSMILNDLFALLAEVSHDTMREIDTIGRPARDFLAICCPETSIENACYAASRLKDALYQIPAKPLFGGARLTLSIGVAVAPDHAKDAEGLIKSAVDACLAASASGGNRIFTASGNRVPMGDSPNSFHRDLVY